ncbi:MAG TPA: prolyl oligopeptidase family serine peptidase [Woeseiaceae bacterium]|nr:prolyl oligopeptidase family serine peptidase [Woeseiaceae bacterium]
MNRPVRNARVGCGRIVLTAVLPALLACALRAEPIPINAWVHDPVIASVGVSPDGNQLVALTLSDVNEAPDITIWDTRNLAATPKRFKPGDSKAIFVQWLNDERLFVIGRQKFDYRIGGRTTKWFRDKSYIVDRNGKEFREILGNRDNIGASLFDSLPMHDNKALVALVNLEFATDIYEINLDSLNVRRVYRGVSGENYIADHDGEVRSKARVHGRGDDARIEYSYLHPETGAWEHHHSLYATRREGMQPVGFDPDRRTVYMHDNTGRDKAVIRKYDLITRELGDPVFADSTFEAVTIIQSRQPEDFGKIIGYIGDGASRFRDYSDEEWETLQSRIDSALPEDQIHTISSISRDFSVAVISSSGPKEPGAYYLMFGGEELIPLGRSRPFLEPDTLADMTLEEYEARDGMRIPAFLTLPTQGSAPYPAVIMPHGGPWARDYQGFDLWAQFLASRGYLVLQPQYRGSDGWGQALWRAGDREWGQKMQDDKDDGARWLVEQGLADPDRIAMYGYSYGGYAAMAAAVRPQSPYQCAIAGAGLSELRTFDKITFENEFQRDYQNPTIGGLSPLDRAAEATIPIFIFHGERDQRVPIEQSEKFVSALKRAGKDVEYLEVVDLWHSYPWFPQHHYAVLTSVEDYLANRCGPGGL